MKDRWFALRLLFFYQAKTSLLLNISSLMPFEHF